MAKKGDSKSKKSSKKKGKKIDLSYKQKFNLSLRYFLISAVLAIVTRIIYLYSESTIYQNTFFLLFIVFFFIAVAFLIAFLAVWFAGKKSKRK